MKTRSIGTGSREMPTDDLDPLDQRPGADEQMIDRETTEEVSARVERALSSLDYERRAVLVAHDFEGISGASRSAGAGVASSGALGARASVGFATPAGSGAGAPPPIAVAFGRAIATPSCEARAFAGDVGRSLAARFSSRTESMAMLIASASVFPSSTHWSAGASKTLPLDGAREAPVSRTSPCRPTWVRTTRTTN